jgi:hypothetical protein
MLKQMAEGVTVTKAAMSILGEGGMLRYSIFKPKPAEPAIG